MEFKTYQRDKARLNSMFVLHKVMLSVLTVALLASMMVCYWLMQHEKIIIVPPTFNEHYWLTSQRGSQSYLRDFVRYLVQLRLSINVGNFQENVATIERFIEPSYLPQFKEAMEDDFEYIKKHHLTMAYNSSAIEIQQDGVKVSGVMSVYAKGVLAETQEKQYKIKISLKNYEPIITEFEVVAHH